MDFKKSLSLDLHANEFVARYSNHLDEIIEKRFRIQDPETIFNITMYWREVDKLLKENQLYYHNNDERSKDFNPVKHMS